MKILYLINQKIHPRNFYLAIINILKVCKIEIKIKDPRSPLYSFYQFMENLIEIQWRFQYNVREINIILSILIKESENFKFLTENLLEFDDKIRQYVRH